MSVNCNLKLNFLRLLGFEIAVILLFSFTDFFKMLNQSINPFLIPYFTPSKFLRKTFNWEKVVFQNQHAVIFMNVIITVNLGGYKRET